MFSINAVYLVIVAAGLLLILASGGARFAGQKGIPVLVVFLALGIAAGSSQTILEWSGIHKYVPDLYEVAQHLSVSYEFAPIAFQISSAAIALILFDGGLNTDSKYVKKALKPASVLATFGVALTAIVVAGLLMAASHLEFLKLSVRWEVAFLIGAIVSSTDAAAVFSILRSGGVNLRKRLWATLELESGLNDPLAVIMTSAAITAILNDTPIGLDMLAKIAWQLIGGGGIGMAVGWLGSNLLRHRSIGSNLYPIVTLGIGVIAFALPSAFEMSGFLSVYVAGIMISSKHVPQRNAVLRAHNFMAWVSQITMFVLLGLLVTPRDMSAHVLHGLLVFIILTFVARPIAVFLLGAPFRFHFKELVFLSWIGLRGSVPILLATMPITYGIETELGKHIFNVIFVVVLLSSVLQGMSVSYAAERLGLRIESDPPPDAILEINTTKDISNDFSHFYIREKDAIANHKLNQIRLPEDASIMLVVRGNDLIAPRGSTKIQAGDHLYAFHHATESDAKMIREAVMGPDDDGDDD